MGNVVAVDEIKKYAGVKKKNTGTRDTERTTILISSDNKSCR